MTSRTATTHDFRGQLAVVTGGARGIGGAVADRLIASNAKVAVWDMDCDEACRKADSFGRNAKGVSVDVSCADSVRKAVAETNAWAGPISVLVNSAGIAGPNANVVDYDLDEWSRIQKINVDGTFLTNRFIVRQMLAEGYGRIVNIASIAGKEGNPTASAYSASKSAVIAFTKALGKETAGSDICVNCVTPAAARTRIFEQISEEHIAYMLSKIPRKRFLEVEEAAAMICWLCTSENSFTTGAVFDLSGGRATY